jgi:hypothetical protein
MHAVHYTLYTLYALYTCALCTLYTHSPTGLFSASSDSMRAHSDVDIDALSSVPVEAEGTIPSARIRLILFSALLSPWWMGSNGYMMV